MFRNGDLVTLVVNKEHNEGGEILRVAAGTAGMIVNFRSRDNLYVVEFGPEGQWNCTAEELHSEMGERSEEDSSRIGDFRIEGMAWIDEAEEAEDDSEEDDREEVSEVTEESSGDSYFSFLPNPTPEPEEKFRDISSTSFDDDLEMMMRKLEKEKAKKR